MNRRRTPSGGDRPPDEPMLDLPLDEGEAETAAAPSARGAASVAGSSGRASRRRSIWLFLLLALVLAGGALAVGYWLRRDPALLTPSSTLLDFGVARLGDAAGGGAADGGEPLAIDFTNSGGRSAALHRLALSGPAAADFAVLEDGCSGLRLAAGASCRVRLGFAPTEDGPRQAVLEIAGEPVNAPLALPLLGVGASGRLAVLPEQVDFEPRTVSEGGPAATVTVDNRGTATVTVEDLRLEGTAGSDYSVSGCRGEELAAGESCAVRIRFTPRAAGERRASLRVVSDAAGRPPLVWLVGRGEERRAALALSPDPLDLGAALVGGEATRGSIAVRNEGDAAARIASAAIADRSLGFTVAGDGCSGRTLAPGSACEISVGWAPAAAGPAETALRLAVVAGNAASGGAAPGGSAPAVRLTGRGEGAALTAEPERLDFGSLPLGAGRESFLTLANPGKVAIPLARVEIEGSESGGDFALGGDCRPGSRLAPAGTCTVTVRFRPRGPGARSARLIAEAAGVRLGVPLAGRGEPPPAPRAVVEPERLDFGTEAIGSRGPIREVRVGNRGDARLPIGGFALEGAHAGDFRLVPGSCDGATFLAPGAECTVGVRFVPSAAGARSAAVAVRHGGPGERGRVQLSGVGS